MGPICEGRRVLDLTQGMAGALAGMVLADNGADVIKAEPPGGGRDRSVPAWIMWNRGKKSVVLDLTTAEGRQAAQQLGSEIAVVIENFRPGTADRDRRGGAAGSDGQRAGGDAVVSAAARLRCR